MSTEGHPAFVLRHSVDHSAKPHIEDSEPEDESVDNAAAAAAAEDLAIFTKSPSGPGESPPATRSLDDAATQLASNHAAFLARQERKRKRIMEESPALSKEQHKRRREAEVYGLIDPVDTEPIVTDDDVDPPRILSFTPVPIGDCFTPCVKCLKRTLAHRVVTCQAIPDDQSCNQCDKDRKACQEIPLSLLPLAAAISDYNQLWHLNKMTLPELKEEDYEKLVATFGARLAKINRTKKADQKAAPQSAFCPPELIESVRQMSEGINMLARVFDKSLKTGLFAPIADVKWEFVGQLPRDIVIYDVDVDRESVATRTMVGAKGKKVKEDAVPVTPKIGRRGRSAVLKSASLPSSEEPSPTLRRSGRKSAKKTIASGIGRGIGGLTSVMNARARAAEEESAEDENEDEDEDVMMSGGIRARSPEL